MTGRLTKDGPSEVEWTGDDRKKVKLSKARIARIDLTFADGTAPGPVPEFDVKDLKSPLFLDRTLGIGMELPKEWSVAPESFAKKLILKSTGKAEVEVRSRFTVAAIDAVWKAVQSSESSKFTSPAWSEGPAVVCPFPAKRYICNFKKQKNDPGRREYVIMQLPGRYITISHEAPVAAMAASTKSLDGILPTLRECEPVAESRYEKHGFSLVEAPKIKLQYRGTSPYTTQVNKLAGEAHNWASEDFVVSVQVFTENIPTTTLDLKTFIADEHKKFSNIAVKAEGELDLLGIEAPWVDFEATIKEGNQRGLMCCLLGAGKMYQIGVFPLDVKSSSAMEIFENVLGVFRCEGMRAAK